MYKIIREKKIYLSENEINNSYPLNITPMFDWMKKFNLDQNITIFDVGANIGLFSLAYAIIYRNASIISFEPVPFIYEIAKKNFKKNDTIFRNIKLENLGLSDKQESMKLSLPIKTQHDRYQDNLNIGLFSIYGKGEENYNADFTTLDKYVMTNNISSLDFIKIDVEGHEYKVLQGGLLTIKKFKPIIMFELNELTLKLSGTTPEAYFKLARENNYEIFGLKYGWNDTLMQIKSVNQIEKVSDLILVSN